jgi:hypothetical protein
MVMLFYLAKEKNKITPGKVMELKPNQKVVYLFPGNPSQHTPTTTLFSTKTGGGLAQVAHDLGKEDYPTLSLPTAHFDNKSHQDRLVKQAMCDVYQALGAGFSLVLPVRNHEPQKIHKLDGSIEDVSFFKNALKACPTQEPCFWGGFAQMNPPLAEQYSEFLDQVATFIDALNENEETALEDLPADYRAAYQLGKQMAQTNGDWVKTQAEEKETKQLIIRAVQNAQQNYAKWFKERNAREPSRGPLGMFSFFRHGQVGQTNALLFLERVAKVGSYNETIDEISALLSSSSSNYNRHSFASFLLDELKKISGTSWFELNQLSDNDNHYDKKEVMDRMKHR